MRPSPRLGPLPTRRFPSALASLRLRRRDQLLLAAGALALGATVAAAPAHADDAPAPGPDAVEQTQDFGVDAAAGHSETVPAPAPAPAPAADVAADGDEHQAPSGPTLGADAGAELENSSAAEPAADDAAEAVADDAPETVADDARETEVDDGPETTEGVAEPAGDAPDITRDAAVSPSEESTAQEALTTGSTGSDPTGDEHADGETSTPAPPVQETDIPEASVVPDPVGRQTGDDDPHSAVIAPEEAAPSSDSADADASERPDQEPEADAITPWADLPATTEAPGTSPTDAVPLASVSARSMAAPTATASSTRRGFKDVTSGNQFRDEILWLQSRGYATGWPDGTYRPLSSINRDAFVTMIYRIKQPPRWRPPATSPFSDVTPDSMYYREITWAAAQGITTGWSDGTFRPRDPIARDAAMAMLSRSFTGTANAPKRSPYLDVTPNRQHYKAIAWGYANGISTGWTDGTFRPSDPIARDATAAMLYRLMEDRLTTAEVRRSGPTVLRVPDQPGASSLGAPTGYQYRYGGGLRQDFRGGTVIYNPSKRTGYVLTGTQRTQYLNNGGHTTFGLPNTARRTHQGTVYQVFHKGGIYSVDGYTFRVVGAEFQRYRSWGGVTGYLGAPIANVATGSSGIRYQSFKGGTISTPAYLDSPPPTTVYGGTRLSYPTLRQGSRGDHVLAVQIKVGAAADGVFGAKTAEAVRAYQRAQRIPVTGIVDSRTWARIISVPDRRQDGTNGRLAPRQLKIIKPGWVLPTKAADAFLAMERQFRKDTGRSFQLNDAYRTIDRQIQMLVAYGRPRASTPGYSNHGSASTGAVDIQAAFGDSTHTWLQRNAARFGFGQTAFQARTEPWHWQYTIR